MHDTWIRDEHKDRFKFQQDILSKILNRITEVAGITSSKAHSVSPVSELGINGNKARTLRKLLKDEFESSSAINMEKINEVNKNCSAEDIFELITGQRIIKG